MDAVPLGTRVLLKSYLCDTLLSIAQEGAFRPLWSDHVRGTVVDQAGRIVLPKFIRDALGLLPGTKVGISPYGAGVQVVPAGSTARLVEGGGVLAPAPSRPEQQDPGVASVLRRGLGYSRPELAAVRQAQLAAGVEPVG